MHADASVVPATGVRAAACGRDSAPRFDLAIFFLLLGVGLAVYWPIFSILPLRGDNFYILAWADATPFGGLLRADPGIYPEWRPLAFASVWIEHRLVLLGEVAIHHFINLLFWVACAWLVYRIVHNLTGSLVAALAAALWLFVDQRAAFTLLWIIGRQTSLACAFGLTAVWIVTRARDRELTGREGAGVGLLLIASALSKEYGLGFALALGAHAIWSRHRDLLWPAAGAAAVYAAMRMSIAGGAFGPYCESMGYFFAEEERCIDPMAAESLAQMAYNVAATAIGILLPGIFDDMGTIAVAPVRLATAVLFLAAAGAGLAMQRRTVGIVGLVPIFVAGLGFMVYRERNHVAGACAIAILVGAGFARLAPLGDRAPTAAAIRAATFALVAMLLCKQAIETRELVSLEVAGLLDADPCESSLRERALGHRFAPIVKARYGMSNPTCAAPD
jgi:hypothetical protein